MLSEAKHLYHSLLDSHLHSICLANRAVQVSVGKTLPQSDMSANIEEYHG